MRLDEVREGMRVRTLVDVGYDAGKTAKAGTLGRIKSVGCYALTTCDGIESDLSFYASELEPVDDIRIIPGDKSTWSVPDGFHIASAFGQEFPNEGDVVTSVRISTNPEGKTTVTRTFGKPPAPTLAEGDSRVITELVASKMNLEITVAKLREENERLRAGLDAMDGATEVGRLGISHRTEKPWYVYDGHVEYHAYRGGECKPFRTASEAYLYACDLLAKEDQP